MLYNVMLFDFWYIRGDGAKQGGYAIFAMHRQQLLTMYHVDGLQISELQNRFRAEFGVYTHRRHIHKWLQAPAQALPVLDNNGDIHSHACGEFVLQQLQQGVSREVVVSQLLQRYLVKATEQRVAAYRTYREHRSAYWNAEKLTRFHWQALYLLVSLEHRLGRRVNHMATGQIAYLNRLRRARSALCANAGIAEDIHQTYNTHKQ